MSACNKEQPALSALVFVLALSALFSGVTACSRQSSKPLPMPVTLFDERPFQMFCSDRPSPQQPGAQEYGKAFITGSQQTPYKRTRLDTFNLPRHEVPALSLAAGLGSWVQIAGANQDGWTVQFCAEGEGNTIDEANGYLQKVFMQRTGSLLTLGSTGAHSGGHLLLTAPAGAPLTVHSDVPVEIHNMDGPVFVSALGRVFILNTTGRLDALAMAIDFVGSQGSVFLNSWNDIDFKITAAKFRGSLGANAQREVHAYFPPGFQTSILVLVDRPKNFVCRADFCSKMKKGRDGGLYRFAYGDAEGPSDRISMRSMDAQVVLDTMP